MGSTSDKQARKDIAKGREQALAQLERIYEGPLRGLQIAPEFFRLLASPDLAGTPLAKGVGIQNQILDEVSAALSGKSFAAGSGGIPEDLRSAVLEATGGAQAGRGVYGSGAGNLELANRFAGVSESLRQSRLQSALAALAGTSAAGSVFPSATAFLQTGVQRAQSAASAIQGSFAQEAQYAFQSAQSEQAARAQLLSIGLGVGVGALTGGLGLGLVGAAAGGGLSGALSGGIQGSGLLPQSFFGGGYPGYGGIGPSLGPSGYPIGYTGSSSPYGMLGYPGIFQNEIRDVKL